MAATRKRFGRVTRSHGNTCPSGMDTGGTLTCRGMGPACCGGRGSVDSHPLRDLIPARWKTYAYTTWSGHSLPPPPLLHLLHHHHHLPSLLLSHHHRILLLRRRLQLLLPLPFLVLLLQLL